MNEDSHVLLINGKEIGFVYYRSGYQVEQYTSENDWKARTILEVSQAIKCPSIDYHLTTFKKFQQSFCMKGVLDEVLGARYASQKDKLQEIFSGMWSLEEYENDP